MFEYFTREEAELFTFYRIPKELFTNPKYKETTSAETKISYGLLLDRNSLSLQNNWLDSEGHVYIFFSREELMETLGIAKPKATSIFKELRDVELIREVRQGLNKPNRIYVGKFIPSQEKKLIKSKEVRNSYVSKKEKITSVGKKKLHQDERISYPNNTDLNKIYNNEIEYTHSALENSSKIERKTVCVDNTPSKINKNIQNLQKEEVEKLQEEIKKIIGQKVHVKKISELLASSSVERINYHLENWHIHKQNQVKPGAGYFITVIANDIEPLAPEKKKTGGTGEKNGNIPLKDNFQQREYTAEQCKVWETAWLDNLDEPKPESKEKKPYTYVGESEEENSTIPHIERKGYI